MPTHTRGFLSTIALATLATLTAAGLGACASSELSLDDPRVSRCDRSTRLEGAALSPDGEHHPGIIDEEDRVGGRSFQRLASDVPQSIGWVWVSDRWEPVLRIEITGAEGQRRITRFGRDGMFLDTTIQAPPTPPAEPVPTP